MKNKITITCTKRQKAYITRSLINAGMCLWPKKAKMCGFDKSSDCMRCFEKKYQLDHCGRAEKGGAME